MQESTPLQIPVLRKSDSEIPCLFNNMGCWNPPAFTGNSTLGALAGSAPLWCSQRRGWFVDRLRGEHRWTRLRRFRLDWCQSDVVAEAVKAGDDSGDHPGLVAAVVIVGAHFHILLAAS